MAKTICCAILHSIAETHSPELSNHQNTQNLMTDSIFGLPGARNHQKPSKINFARFLSSPSTPGPNLALGPGPLDLCGIFGFSSPSTLGPYNIGPRDPENRVPLCDFTLTSGQRAPGMISIVGANGTRGRKSKDSAQIQRAWA